MNPRKTDAVQVQSTELAQELIDALSRAWMYVSDTYAATAYIREVDALLQKVRQAHRHD